MKDKIARTYANDIIGELVGRGGFDHWWGNLDDDIQEEILVALSDIIKRDRDEVTETIVSRGLVTHELKTHPPYFRKILSGAKLI